MNVGSPKMRTVTTVSPLFLPSMRKRGHYIGNVPHESTISLNSASNSTETVVADLPFWADFAISALKSKCYISLSGFPFSELACSRFGA